MDVHNTSLTGVNMQEIMSVFLFQTDRYSENNVTSKQTFCGPYPRNQLH